MALRFWNSEFGTSTLNWRLRLKAYLPGITCVCAVCKKSSDVEDQVQVAGCPMFVL